MDLGLFDFTAAGALTLVAVIGVAGLLALLVISFLSRPRVFCQYLRHMTGIELKPGMVKRRYKARGRGAVRDLLIDLLIREDLADASRTVTPDSKPDMSVFEGD